MSHYASTLLPVAAATFTVSWLLLVLTPCTELLQALAMLFPVRDKTQVLLHAYMLEHNSMPLQHLACLMIDLIQRQIDEVLAKILTSRTQPDLDAPDVGTRGSMLA